MKRLFTFTIFVFVVALLNAANGYDVSFNQPSSDVYQLDFSLGDYNITEVNIAGENYSQIQFDGSVFTQLKGFAELPFISASLILDNINVTLKVIEGEYEEYSLINPLVPSRGVIYRDQDPASIPYEISPGSLRDNWYPQNLAKNSSPFIIKDLRGTSVYVYPFRYNAVQNVLRVYKNITVQLIENETTPLNPLSVQATKILRERGIYPNRSDTENMKKRGSTPPRVKWNSIPQFLKSSVTIPCLFTRKIPKLRFPNRNWRRNTR